MLFEFYSVNVSGPKIRKTFGEQLGIFLVYSARLVHAGGLKLHQGALSRHIVSHLKTGTI